MLLPSIRSERLPSRPASESRASGTVSPSALLSPQSYEASGVQGKELGPLPCLLLGAGGRPGCARLDEVALLPAGPGGASG